MLIGGPLFELECYKLRSGDDTIFCHVCGESEEAGPRTEKDEAGVWREQLLNALGPERETGRGLLIPGGSTDSDSVSHEARGVHSC